MRVKDPHYFARYHKQWIDSKMTNINNVKSSGCYYCHLNEIICIDLHHIDPTTKLFQINSSAVQTHTEEEIRKELKKCIPVCKNCHSKYHAGLLPKPKIHLPPQIPPVVVKPGRKKAR